MNTSVTFQFSGKRALVTGAGQGIGRAIAVALVAAGAETFALSKTQTNLDALVAECPSIHAVCVDLSDWTATRKAVEKIGPIDLLVNNAAITILRPFLEVAESEIDKVFDVNVKAVINVSQIVAQSLISRKSPGSIVNISSQGSERVFPSSTAYCASKGALNQVTRMMALELGPHQIRVNSVNPGVVTTEMSREGWSNEAIAGHLRARIPIGRFVDVSDVMNPVLYLLSDSASMINGTFLTVDGGATVH